MRQQQPSRVRRVIKQLLLAVLLLTVWMMQYPDTVLAQACAPTATVNALICTKEIDDFQNESCETGYRTYVNVSCNQTTCQTESDYCSSNDASKCTLANNCNVTPCSPATCGTGGPGGACPSECRQGSACGVGYSDAYGCSGSGPGGGCKSNQVCCSANSCGGGVISFLKPS